MDEHLLSSPDVQLLRQAFMGSVNGIVIVDAQQPDLPLIYVNPAFERLTGYTATEIIGRNCRFLQGEDRDQDARHDIRAALTQGQSVTTVLRNYRKDGTMFQNELSLSVIRDVTGTVTHFIGFQKDVTEETRMQRRLEESEEQSRSVAAALQRLLDLSPDLIVSTDTDGHFVTVSAASSRLLGYLPEEMIGHSTSEFIHPEDRAASSAEIPHSRTGHATTTVQQRWLHRDGSVIWMEWSAVVMPGEDLLYSVGRDVTHRRDAEEAESFLVAIVQASHNAIIGLALDNTIRFWNPSAEALYGYTAVEAIGRPVTFLVPVEFQGLEIEMIERSKQGQNDPPFEASRITKSGQAIQLMVTISPVLDAAGQVVGVSKIARDITALRQAEREVQALNEGLREQLTHVTGLREVDQSIAASADLYVTLGLILDHIRRQLNVDAVTVLLLDQHALTLEYAVERGFTTALRGLKVRLGEDLAGQVALNRQPLLIPDLRTVDVSPTWRAMLEKERIMAYYGAPIITKGKVLGVIEVLHRKPFEPSPAWLETFDDFDNQAAIAVDSSSLFAELERRNLELRLAYDETIEGWARALDLRDRETEGHSRRVTELTVALCQRLGLYPEQLVQVRRGALLHDIGKMGIPDAVLLKPGPLTDDEWVRMKQHPGYAVDLLSPIQFLRPAMDIPQYHHEKWDGSGYPLGLQGWAIPMTARAFAVVDVYDALTSDRPYRSAWTREKALEHIQDSAGTHFDPVVVQEFIQMLQRE
jgi:PAS domain S-box-containing protein